jgi:hypothetical protein
MRVWVRKKSEIRCPSSGAIPGCLSSLLFSIVLKLNDSRYSVSIGLLSLLARGYFTTFR